jgi:hypothetical protein
MAQKPMLRAEVYARALRASQNVKRAEKWADVVIKLFFQDHPRETKAFKGKLVREF